ncbi:DUF6544 family protein [Hymenobacter sp. CRA2]|uniref:DUF6544 family protein n=1 Tax=Hymenobacter sp. CRA2 TaxID=1955620 RepID=UPI00098FFCAD|nr:DUF6544 family protein [Hymenobacter sp. CRA2]OON69932.1 hypothetical protein B0919_04055 [Hymenobacter sp. CRA2]
MVRWLLSAVLLLHALIHLLGLRFVRLPAALTGVELPAGWALAALLLGTSGVGLALHRSWWWAPATLGLLLSQGLIVLHWSQAWAGTIINVGLALSIAVAAAQTAAARRVRDEAQALAATAAPTPITAERLARLPAAAQRYLAYAGVKGNTPVPAAVSLRQTGRIRTGPNQPWLAMEAEQHFAVRPASFLWLATMQWSGVPFLQVQDRYAAGHGRSQVRAGALLPLGSSQGPEMDLGALQRYLAEAVWFPAAYVQDNVHLTAAGDHAFTATLAGADPRAAVTLHVDDAGKLTEITARRYREVAGAFELADWSVQPLAYGTLEGLRMPTACRVVWRLPAGDFAPILLTVTELQYQWRSTAGQSAPRVALTPVTTTNGAAHAAWPAGI